MAPPILKWRGPDLAQPLPVQLPGCLEPMICSARICRRLFLLLITGVGLIAQFKIARRERQSVFVTTLQANLLVS